MYFALYWRFSFRQPVMFPLNGEKKKKKNYKACVLIYKNKEEMV